MARLLDRLAEKGLKPLDLSQNEMAKLHVRHMVGGRAAGGGLASLGVVPPLWRCLRLPIVEALRTD